MTSGISDGVVTTFQSTPPSGTAFPYIEYILGNPSGGKVLLDFPGDERVIKFIDLKYANIAGGGKAKVQVWAK